MSAGTALRRQYFFSFPLFPFSFLCFSYLFLLSFVFPPLSFPFLAFFFLVFGLLWGLFCDFSGLQIRTGTRVGGFWGPYVDRSPSGLAGAVLCSIRGNVYTVNWI